MSPPNIAAARLRHGLFCTLVSSSLLWSSHAGANTPPTISGTPPTTATDGKVYTFTPRASDADGNALSFSVKNKPDWATFSSHTGTLSGTPVWTGTDGAIAISVSDGHTSVSLAPFSITISRSALPVAPSSVTINWTPPTENVDGSTLTNLAGYHLYYGTSASSLTHVVNITNPGLASYVVSNLSAATWYFSVTSINSKGTESPRSAVVAAVVQ